MMFIPVTDNRYFTLGVDNLLLEQVSVYTADEYELAYPLISSSMPNIFSANLRDEIELFVTSAPPAFKVPIDDLISLSCYYYNDWESVNAVTDDVIKAEAVENLRKSLLRASYDSVTADEMLQEQIAMLTEALQRFIGVIVGVLSRAGVPAIMDYGSCYRLSNLDNIGNVYFTIRTPSSVYVELDGEEESTIHELRGF